MKAVFEIQEVMLRAPPEANRPEEPADDRRVPGLRPLHRAAQQPVCRVLSAADRPVFRRNAGAERDPGLRRHSADAVPAELSGQSAGAAIKTRPVHGYQADRAGKAEPHRLPDLPDAGHGHADPAHRKRRVGRAGHAVRLLAEPDHQPASGHGVQPADDRADQSHGDAGDPAGLRGGVRHHEAAAAGAVPHQGAHTDRRGGVQPPPGARVH